MALRGSRHRVTARRDEDLHRPGVAQEVECAGRLLDADDLRRQVGDAQRRIRK
jgi:hypothetical protein